MQEASNHQRTFCRLAGGFLLLLPFIPINLIFGQIKGVEKPFLVEQWLTGLTIVGFISLLVLWLLPKAILDRGFAFLERLFASASSSRASVLIGFCATIIFLVSHFAFYHRPHLVDSVIQLFQAQLFAQGMLKAPPIAHPEFVMNQHLIFTEQGWYGQYPPLHSLLLAIGVLFSFPWLTQWICSVGAAWCIYRLASHLYGKETAIAVLSLLLFCPFFLFMSGSAMNHVSTLFFISAFLLSFCLWEKTDLRRYLCLAGALLACAFLIRPLTAIAFGVPFGCFALGKVVATKDWRAVLAGLVGFFPIALLLFAYNFLTTGDPWLSGYVKLWGARHEIGFHESPWGELHTPLTGLRNELIDITLLNEFFFEAPIPALLPMAAFLLFSRRLSRWDFRLVLAFLVVPFCYGFYWHRDAFLGPRFLFETLPCISILIARGITTGIKDLSGKQFGSEVLFGKVLWQRFAITCLLVAFLVMLLVGIPQRFTVTAWSLWSMKRSIVAEAQAAGIDEGVIFVKVSWGNRLLARLRGIGVSASLAQRAYSFVDHCMLEEIVDSHNSVTEELEQRLEELVAQKMKLLPEAQVARLTPDGSLKLRPQIVPAAQCREELEYDQTDFTVYIAALVENTPALDGPFVVVRDLRERNAIFMKGYPGKPAYLYDGVGFKTLGDFSS